MLYSPLLNIAVIHISWNNTSIRKLIKRLTNSTKLALSFINVANIFGLNDVPEIIISETLVKKILQLIVIM